MKMVVLLLFVVWNAVISPVASELSPLVRKNTQCSLATIVPSNVTSLHPYIDNSNTTFDVNSFTAALRDNAPPQIYTCPNDNGGYGTYNPTKIRGVKSAWYKFTPSTSNYYDIMPTDIFPYSDPFSQWISVIEGASCSTGTNVTSSIGQTPIGCKLDYVRGVYLQAGKTYQITIFIDANYPIRFAASERFSLKIMPTMNRPSNDDCSNATTIPSTVPLPFTTNSINVSDATIQVNETFPSCDAYQTFPLAPVRAPKKDSMNFGGGSVWYTYTPSTTGYYNFSTVGTIIEGPYAIPAPITIAVYEGGSQICNFKRMQTLIKEVYCKRAEGLLDRTTKLQAGILYYIQIIPDYYTRPVYDKMYFTIDRTEAPPINDECTNAITIDPLAGLQNAPVSSVYASTEVSYYPLGLNCSTFQLTNHGIWYKFDSKGGSNFITTQLCINLDLRRGNPYYVFEGQSCQSLKCTQQFPLQFCPNSNPGRFVTSSKPTTYYFYLQPNFLATNFSVHIQGDHFNLINADNDTVITPLEQNGTYSYSRLAAQNRLPSSQLNVQAYFDPELKIQSSRITLIQNQKRTRRCERYTPISVFGDRDGNYHSVLLPIGNYSISAIPYTQAGCQGQPLLGNTITNDFTIQGCTLGYLVRVSNRNFLPLNRVMTSLPCNSFISGVVNCAFPVQKVQVELINAMNNTNTSIILDTVYQSPYFYIGKTSNATSLGIIPIINRISPSPKYILTVTIDNIVHPSYEFAIQRSCTRG